MRLQSIRLARIGQNLKCDTLIVGAGITGSLVAERLTRQGIDVVIIDREYPGRGSTAASTSMLLWEIDRPLAQLTEIYGFERAARAYRASLEAVDGLKMLVRGLGIPCEMRDRNSLYLAAGDSSRLCWRSIGFVSGPACRASFWTMRPCSLNSASRGPRQSSHPARPIQIRCNWRAGCSSWP